jgi:RNA polymerase sigma-70 factor (ECF subfamily)
MNISSAALDSFGPDWVARVRSGDREAFEAMAEAYYERLVRYAYTFVRDVAVAEDVVQDILLALWLGREQFAVRSALSGYLFKAVRNRALNHIRHERAQERLEERLSAHGDPDILLSTQAQTPSESDEDDEEAACATRVAAVQQAVAALSQRQAEAFRLRIEHGLSFSEVAVVMGLSLRSAETTYQRAVKTLREQLAPYVS